MKKIILLITVVFLLSSVSFATEADKRYHWADSYHYTETIPSGNVGKIVKLIPPIEAGRTVTAEVIVSEGGIGTIWTTRSPDAAVLLDEKADPGLRINCVWRQWTPGEVTESTEAVYKGTMTGIYGEAILGDITINIIW